MTRDPYNLQRFVDAQEPTYSSVVYELKAGRKRGHWMWYIFPQARGLGRSGMAEEYAIKSRAEAQAYWGHDVLGPRLRECTELVVDLQATTAERIFAYPDHLKFRSCMTLFEQTASDPTLFRAALEKYFGGTPDPATVEILRKW